MDIIKKRKIVTSLFFGLGVLFLLPSIYLIGTGNNTPGAIAAILGGFSLLSGIYLHGWLELNAMADLKDYVDKEAEKGLD